MMMMIMINLN